MIFARIELQYIKCLNKVDGRVQYTDPVLGKASKPFLGILFQQGNIEYFAPISSPKPKHLTMSNSRDFHKILDASGGVLAVINFNNMVPVTSALYRRIDFNLDKDGRLLKKEYAFCAKNATVLSKKAADLYNRHANGKLTEAEKERTCDFASLEREMNNYLMLLAPSAGGASMSTVTASNQSTDGTAQATAQPTVSSQLLSMASNIPAAPQGGAAQTQATKKNDNINES